MAGCLISYRAYSRAALIIRLTVVDINFKPQHLFETTTSGAADIVPPLTVIIGNYAKNRASSGTFHPRALRALAVTKH